MYYGWIKVIEYLPDPPEPTPMPPQNFPEICYLSYWGILFGEYGSFIPLIAQLTGFHKLAHKVHQWNVSINLLITPMF
jgi:hypothetical protein